MLKPFMASDTGGLPTRAEDFAGTSGPEVQDYATRIKRITPGKKSRRISRLLKRLVLPGKMERLYL
jgi:hypothetical protein